MKPTPLPIGTKQVLVAFPTLPDDPGREHWSCSLSATVRVPFLPLGLFLWGVTDETFVVRLMIGNQLEVELNCEPIPARFFQSNYTFEGLLQLAERGELELAIAQRQMLEMREASPNMSLTLQMKGPFTQACLWGLTYAGGAPTLAARIEEERVPVHTGRAEVTYTGQLIERRLRGDVVIGEASAPSEASVCALLAALRPRGY